MVALDALTPASVHSQILESILLDNPHKAAVLSVGCASFSSTLFSSTQLSVNILLTQGEVCAQGGGGLTLSACIDSISGENAYRV